MIRQAQVSDLERIVELETKIFKTSLGYAFLKQELLENEFSRIFVYENELGIIGYISYRVIDQNADILNFLVEEPYQHQGIGKELFSYILLELKENNVKSLVLEVRKSNIIAQEFYKKFGAKHVHTLENYYLNEDAYIMLLEDF